MAIRRGQGFGIRIPHSSGEPTKLKVVYTGEKRRPKKGEFFISGAIPTAYQAVADMDTVHCIAVEADRYKETLEDNLKLTELEYKLLMVIQGHTQEHKDVYKDDVLSVIEDVRKKVAGL